jgi:hypothetical protein
MIRAVPSVIAGKRKWNPIVKANWIRARSNAVIYTSICYTNSLSSANFVGFVVCFLNVLVIRLRSLLLAASLSFEIKMVIKY